MTDKNLDKIVAAYIKIRDARTAKKREWEDRDHELQAQQEVLSTHLLQTMREQNVESLRTKHGTAYQSVAIKPSCTDWNAFYAWIKDNDALDALEKRVKKSFIVDYKETNSGTLPPGIAVTQEYVITIRRS